MTVFELPLEVLAELRIALLALEELLTELPEVLAELRIALLALEPELALERTELEPVPELALERTALELEKEFELLEGLLLLTVPELLPEEELELRLTCCAPERVLVSVPDVEAELRTAPEVRVALELRVTLEL